MASGNASASALNVPPASAFGRRERFLREDFDFEIPVVVERGRAREETEREAERRERREECLAVRLASFVAGWERWDEVVVVAAGEGLGFADFEAAAARARMGLRGAYSWSDRGLLASGSTSTATYHAFRCGCIEFKS